MPYFRSPSLALATAGAAALLSLAIPARLEAAEVADAGALLRRAASYLDFPDSEMTMAMEVLQDGRVQRSYLMTVQRKDSERVRIEFLGPDREKGRKLLRVGDKMWMFLPDLGKSIVISARQSFLGSSLSNGDLLRTDLIADYTPTYLRSESLGGRPVHVLDLRARGRGVTYDRIVLSVDRETAMPVREEFYTRSGKLVKTMELSQPETFDGQLVATVMVIESTLRKSESTVLTIRDLVTGADLSPVLFSKESLDRL